MLVDEGIDSTAWSLKAELEKAAGDAGLVTKTKLRAAQASVLSRISIEELEAWFFGDVELFMALTQDTHPALPRGQSITILAQ